MESITDQVKHGIITSFGNLFGESMTEICVATHMVIKLNLELYRLIDILGLSSADARIPLSDL